MKTNDNVWFSCLLSLLFDLHLSGLSQGGLGTDSGSQSCPFPGIGEPCPGTALQEDSLPKQFSPESLCCCSFLNMYFELVLLLLLLLLSL